MGTIKTKAKTIDFKVGDWITTKNTVFMRIEAVIDSGLGPMYCCTSPRSESVKWYSAYELEDDRFEKREPDFKRFNKIRAGDILKVGHDDNAPYLTILARQGNAVLLSTTPDKQKYQMIKHVEKMMREVSRDEGLDFDEILGEEEKRHLKRMGSQLHASKVAGEWKSIEWITLMNWQLISEEI